MRSYKKAIITENKKINENVWLMKVKSEIHTKPGEFFMIRSDVFGNDPLLSRPFSVSDEKNGEISFLYLVVGKATNLMTKFKIGHEMKILGPLGKGFRYENSDDKKIALVAGGVGIAPLLYLAKKLKNKADLYAGFSKDSYYLDEFRPYVNNIFTTSDLYDKKFITEILDPNEYDLIYACGPNPMLKSLCDKNNKALIQISMESHMACGIGACLGCTVKTNEGNLRVCKDGPVFDSKEIF